MIKLAPTSCWWRTSAEAIEISATTAQQGPFMRRKLDRLAFTRIVLLVTRLGLSMGLSVIAHGQASTVGSISGTVRDAQGAVISNAEVLIQEERTGFSRTVVANDEGFYSALSLPFGRYSVSTASQGFKKTVSSGVELHVNENLVINLTLAVGQLNETVNVYRDATPVETRSANVSSLVSEKQVAELPLNGRNYAALLLVVPGVSPTNDNFSPRGTGLDHL
jgi:hypothetical protein